MKRTISISVRGNVGTSEEYDISESFNSFLQAEQWLEATKEKELAEDEKVEMAYDPDEEVLVKS